MTKPRSIGWILALALALLWVGRPAPAHADGVARATAETRLRSRPNDQAPAVGKVSEGQTVRIIGRQGRWLKVSVRGRTGWVPRSTINEGGSAPAAAAAAREARPARPAAESRPAARERKGGWSSRGEDARGQDAVAQDPPKEEARPAREVAQRKRKGRERERERPAREERSSGGSELKAGQTVVVTRDAPVRRRPTARAAELYELEKGEEVKVLLVDDDGEWVRIEDEDGSRGWVQASVLEAPKPKAPPRRQARRPPPPPDDDDEDDDDWDDDEDDRPKRKARSGRASAKKKASGGGSAGGGALAGVDISAGANLSFLSKSQSFSSPGTSVAANYKLTNSSPAVAVGVGAVKDFGGFFAGLELGGLLTVGGKGITIDTPDTMDEPPLPWSYVSIDARLFGGVPVAEKYAVTGRLGYHRAATTVKDHDVARLPSERISGFTVGAGFEAPRLTPEIGARVAVEALLGAGLVQNASRQDGDDADVSAYYLSLGGVYHIQKSLDATAGATVGYEKIGFSGPSAREEGVMEGKRTDLQLVLGVGLAYRF